MDLLLVRHALPEVVTDVEHADPPLTAEGRAQAEALADAWADRGVDAVVSSPARRALETAAPLAGRLGVEVTTDERLLEVDWGSGDYLPYEELRARDPAAAAALSAAMAGEDDAATAWRAGIVTALDELVAANRGRRVVVACHGGVVAAYVAHLLGGPAAIPRIGVTYASVSWVLASGDGRRLVRTLNDVAHLAAAGLRVPYWD